MIPTGIELGHPERPWLITIGDGLECHTLPNLDLLEYIEAEARERYGPGITIHLQRAGRHRGTRGTNKPPA